MPVEPYTKYYYKCGLYLIYISSKLIITRKIMKVLPEKCSISTNKILKPSINKDLTIIFKFEMVRSLSLEPLAKELV